MTFGEKWETGKGFPGIDSLKLIANLFDTTIDELISDGDIDDKKRIDEKNSRKMYFVAIGFLVAAMIFNVFAYIFGNPHITIGSAVCAIGYVAFGLLSKPKYRRLEAKKLLLPYLISRLVVFVLVIGLMVYAIITLT